MQVKLTITSFWIQRFKVRLGRSIRSQSPPYPWIPHQHTHLPEFLYPSHLCIHYLFVEGNPTPVVQRTHLSAARGEQNARRRIGEAVSQNTGAIARTLTGSFLLVFP